MPRPKARLKSAKKPPRAFSIASVRRSLGASCPLSSSAASAGERVSELTAEITVEMAMVSANCL
jgi:hypothetical protein